MKTQGRDRYTTSFYSVLPLIGTEKKKKKRRNKQANVVSGRPERMATALRTFSSFCDFTDSLWRSSLRSSVSIHGDKIYIAGLSCGCLQEERVKITECCRDTGRWELRDNVEPYPFLLYYSCHVCLLYLFSSTSSEVTSFKFNIKGHRTIGNKPAECRLSPILPLFFHFLFWNIKRNKNAAPRDK